MSAPVVKEMTTTRKKNVGRSSRRIIVVCGGRLVSHVLWFIDEVGTPRRL